MHSKEDMYQQKIKEYFSDMKITSIKPSFDQGLHNDLMLINDELMVRFAKADFAKDLLENELKCINLIRKKTNIPVPKMEQIEHGIVYYPYIHGEALFRHRLFDYSEIRQKRILEQLGDYLHQMHSIPLSAVKEAGINVSPASTDNPNKYYETLIESYRRVKADLYPHMRNYTRSCIDASFRGLQNGAAWFHYTPCLIHGDLGLEHIIMDEKYENINGIIDFGVAGIGNPRHDIGVLLDGLGESFTLLLSQTYPDLLTALSRAKVGMNNTGWHIRGLETNDLFWHLVHLMTAKDIRY